MISSTKIMILFGLVGIFKLAQASPDSAGIVEMVNGLAYGGIPYGSVSGMLNKYPSTSMIIKRTREFQIDQSSPYAKPFGITTA